VTTTTSEVIHTNKKHPFFTEEQGFLPVGQLKLGMHVLRADGRYGVITGYKLVPGAKTMYNLEVAQDHTFTVGVGQWVVHNCGATGNDDPAQRLAQVRQDLGMVARSTSPDDGQTLAILEADGKEYWGINGDKPISFSVNAISKTHAEIDTLDQLARDRSFSGVTGGTGSMWVDRPPCLACGLYGGIRSGVRAAGLDWLDIWYPGGSMSIFP
jgi:hypothetical protein